MAHLIIASNAGFCFGVRRSVDMAEKMLEEHGTCFSLGDLIHNSDVVASLKSQGMQVVSEVDELTPGADVIIRSHGISKAEHDELAALGCNVCDATCPKVLHIHRIVEKADSEGRQPVIIGSAEHPEVRAICGWCSSPLVFPDADAFADWLMSDPQNADMPITVIFQTTQTQEKRESVGKTVKNMCTNCETFDTICVATSTRQDEARVLSSKCDAIIVIGGRHSANSIHLAEICSEHCDNVQFIENANEIDISALRTASTIGVTAGASTPAWIIKEVKQKMSDEIRIEELTEGPVADTATEEPAAESVAEEAPAASAEESPETEAAPQGAEQEAPVQEAAEDAGALQEPVPEVEPVERTFDELLEDSIKTIYNGETVSGVVAAITATEVSLDLGTKQSGYIPVSEFANDETNQTVHDVLKVGDTIEAVVVRVNDVEGTVMLSKRRLDAVKNWSDIELAREEGTVVEGTVIEDNKGGVVVSVKGINVFVPASQSGLGKDVPMSELVKKKVRLKITEVNRGRRRVVGSIRAVQSVERRERSEKIWNEIEIGKHYEGIVKSLTSFGAFVDIGGIDGMVHVSELSWTRIKQPSDIISVGDTIDVYVIGFDKDTRKISLGYKDPAENPWLKFTSAFEIGSVANVKIVKLMTFGAFAEVVPGVDGLIHISQIANRRIGKPDEVLTVGEYVYAKITNIDYDNKKISLSIRVLSEPEPAPAFASDEQDIESAETEDDALVYEVSATGEATGFSPEEEETVE